MSADTLHDDLFGSDDDSSPPLDAGASAQSGDLNAHAAPIEQENDGSLGKELFSDDDDDVPPSAPAGAVAEASVGDDISKMFDDEEGQELPADIAEQQQQQHEKKKDKKEKKKKKKKHKHDLNEEDVDVDVSGDESELEKQAQQESFQSRVSNEQDKHIMAAGPHANIKTRVKPTFNNEAQLYLVSLPNVVGFSSTEFDPATYEVELHAENPLFSTKSEEKKKNVKKEKSEDNDDGEEVDLDVDDDDDDAAVEGDDFAPRSSGGDGGAAAPPKKQVRLNVENIIRWRYVRDQNGEIVKDELGNPKRESNARYVRWSDGSIQLLLGNEVFNILTQDKSSSQNYCYLQMNSRQLLQKSVGRFKGMMKFRVTGMESKSHAKLKEVLSATHVKMPKIKRQYNFVNIDTSKAALMQLEKDEEAKARKRARAEEKERGKQPRARDSRRFNASFLEGDDEDGEAEGDDEELTGSSALKRKRNFDDDPKRLLSAKSYGYEDDDDGEPEESRKKSKKSKREEEADENVKDELPDDEQEDVVMKKKSKIKKNRLDDDDDDEEDE